VRSARALRTLLERLRDTGKCVLLCSHLMAEVSLVCDSVIVIARGKAVAQGPPAELMRATNARTLEEAFLELTA
jgi:sodium transport system ATP-binding protein